MLRITQDAARRAALAAQGFTSRAPSGPVDRRHLQRVLRQTGLFQIDSVSVVARAHYLPLFSRLGRYDQALLDEAAWGRKRLLFEYWAHEASLVPLDLYPLLRWRMAEALDGVRVWGNVAKFGREERRFVDTVLARVRQEGALAASEIEGAKGEGGWWGWSHGKRALEYLFWTGQVTAAGRRGFERVYDLPERVLPASVIAAPEVEKAEAVRGLLCIAARALGVATVADLRDYFRLSAVDMTGRVAELVEMGALVPVEVTGWGQPAFAHAQTVWPRRVRATALLCPFDPLVWDRARTERMFGFRYRLEIYTPAEKRVHGYYVFPFLLNEALVARVDLKADRATGVLRVLAAHAEEDAPAGTAARLAQALGDMARWLGLGGLAVSNRGDLARALRQESKNVLF